jgi:hypothetical protein
VLQGTRESQNTQSPGLRFRATLARQMLVDHELVTVTETVERLAG